MSSIALWSWAVSDWRPYAAPVARRPWALRRLVRLSAALAIDVLAAGRQTLTEGELPDLTCPRVAAVRGWARATREERLKRGVHKDVLWRAWGDPGSRRPSPLRGWAPPAWDRPPFGEAALMIDGPVANLYRELNRRLTCGPKGRRCSADDAHEIAWSVEQLVIGAAVADLALDGWLLCVRQEHHHRAPARPRRQRL